MVQKLSSLFLQTMSDRGLLHQATDLEKLDQRMSTESIKGYIGFDLTAKSLHVGSLLPIIKLKWLQICGHQPVVLMGGGTTKIGDPSGKDSARKMLHADEINENKKLIAALFERFLNFDGAYKNPAVMVDNDLWLSELSYIDLLREVGPYFNISRMLSFDSVATRLEREQSLSFLEFNYMILQAYDFYELNRVENCILQLGGSDQWGNIVCGIELARKKASKTLYGLTAPLLTTATGAKMGKTAGGAVWLNEDHTSVYDFWQYWRNVDDQDVIRFLKLFTFLDLEEIDALKNLQGKAINDAKILLANTVTAFVHGEEKAQAAEHASTKVFIEGQSHDDAPYLSIQSLQGSSMLLTQLIVDLGFASSSSQARRLIEGGGVRVDGEKIMDIRYHFTFSDISDALKIEVGKKKIGFLKP